MSLLKGIAAFSGWLTGALAGVGAILYALGYLVTRAHLNFLGVSGLFDQSNFFFVQEGAMFLLDICVIAARTLLPIVVVLGVIAAVFSIVGYGMGRILAARDPNLAERVNGWKKRDHFVARSSPFAPSSIYRLGDIVLHSHRHLSQ